MKLYDVLLKHTYIEYKYDEVNWEEEENIVDLEAATFEEVVEALDPYLNNLLKEIEYAIRMGVYGNELYRETIGHTFEEDMLYIIEHDEPDE